MKLKVTVKNRKRLTQTLLKIPEAMREPIAETLWLAANKVKNDAQRSMRGPKSGDATTIYHGGTKVEHIPSAPGEPPAVVSSRLVTNIVAEVDRSKLVAAAGTDVPYGAIFETSKKKKVKRPWLKPAYMRQLKIIKKMIAKTVNKVLKKFRRAT